MEAFPTATWKPLQDKLRNIYALHKAAAGSLTCGGQKNDLISGIAFYNWCVKVTDLGKYECNARLNQTKSLKQFTASTLPALHQVNEISKLTTSKTIKSSKKQAKKTNFQLQKMQRSWHCILWLTMQYVYPFLHGIWNLTQYENKSLKVLAD